MSKNTNLSKSRIRKLWCLLERGEQKKAINLFALILLGMFVELLGIGLVIPAIAIMTQENLGENFPVIIPVLEMLGDPSRQSLIVGGILVLLFVYSCKAIYLSFLAVKQANFSFGVQVQISQRLYKSYLNQSYTFHIQRNSAQLIRNIVTEVNMLTFNNIIPGIMICSEGLVMVGIVALLFVAEPMGAVAVVSIISVLGFLFYRFARHRLTHWGKERQLHEGLKIQELQQGFGGIKDIKLLGREDNFLSNYFVHNTQSASAGKSQQILKQLPSIWLELIALMGISVLLLVMLFRGNDMSNILPTLGLFTAAAFRLMPSVNRILASVQSFRFGMPVIDTLTGELRNNSFENTNSEMFTNTFSREVKIENIYYQYPEVSSYSLDDISLNFSQGKTVGFIGESGSGKSTLIDIILGLLPPQKGRVVVDDVDISEQIRVWQNQIGYVPQVIFLSDDTLERNVAFGLNEIDINKEQVWRAIRLAKLDDYVKTLPDGLDTIVGERGVRLSGGQRQRIGIARALYHDPEVLVLDEATSALDVETESCVMEAISELHGDKTIIIIAHRLATVEICDYVYKLEKGKLVGEGVPAEMFMNKAIVSNK